jgi:hypothetical protein
MIFYFDNPWLEPKNMHISVNCRNPDLHGKLDFPHLDYQTSGNGQSVVTTKYSSLLVTHSPIILAPTQNHHIDPAGVGLSEGYLHVPHFCCFIATTFTLNGNYKSKLEFRCKKITDLQEIEMENIPACTYM